MPSYHIKHLTRYAYAAPVIDCANQLMVYPLADEHLTVSSHEVTISQQPETAFFTDYFGNRVGVFSLNQPHTELVIESNLAVTTRPIFFPMDEQPAAAQWQELFTRRQQATFLDFLDFHTSPLHEEVRNALSQEIDLEEKPLKNALMLSEYVYNHFAYQQGVTNVETPIAEIWRLRAGVCQDFAHMLLFMLRLAGIPARYVSGYVCPRHPGVRGAGATHAWVEAYIPFYGWLGLDPTNNCIVSDGHVRVAIGRQFADCTPVKGTYKGTGEHTLTVAVHIEGGSTDQPAYATGVPAAVPGPAVSTVAPGRNSYQQHLRQQQQQQQQQQ